MQIFFNFFFFTVEELEFSLFVFLCHVPHRERPRSTGNRIYLLRLHPEVFINNILNKSCFPELITKVTKERAQCTVPIRQPLTMLQCYFFIFLKKLSFTSGALSNSVESDDLRVLLHKDEVLNGCCVFITANQSWSQ